MAPKKDGTPSRKAAVSTPKSESRVTRSRAKVSAPCEPTSIQKKTDEIVGRLQKMLETTSGLLELWSEQQEKFHQCVQERKTNFWGLIDTVNMKKNLWPFEEFSRLLTRKPTKSPEAHTIRCKCTFCVLRTNQLRYTLTELRSERSSTDFLCSGLSKMAADTFVKAFVERISSLTQERKLVEDEWTDSVMKPFVPLKLLRVPIYLLNDFLKSTNASNLGPLERNNIISTVLRANRALLYDLVVAHCPCVVGCLYMVTDGEIDAVFMEMLRYLNQNREEEKTESGRYRLLLRAVKHARGIASSMPASTHNFLKTKVERIAV